jgi:hypothetical protein
MHARALCNGFRAPLRFPSLSRTRSLPLLYAFDSGAEQAASLILDTAVRVKDMDENSQVDGNRCILSRVRAGVRAAPPLGFPSLSRTRALPLLAALK